jgi:cell wall-associated NlpC family hydrolase
MKKRIPGKREKYSIIIASETDARKRSASLSLTRRTLIVGLSAVIFIVFVCAGTAVFSACRISDYSLQIENLKKQIEEQSALSDSYNSVKYSAGYTPQESVQPQDTEEVISSKQTTLQNYETFEGTVGSPEAHAVPTVSPTPTLAPSPTFSPTPALTPALTPTLAPSVSISAEIQAYLTEGTAQATPASSAAENIAMKDAVENISAEFQSSINAQIAEAKSEQKYDSFSVEYDGDMDGDSDTVNNWADVISVFIVETMADGQKLLTITPENIKILSEVYNEMNSISITSEKSAAIKEDPINGDETVETLTIHVTVNSLTYIEASATHDFSKKQKKMLEALMSPAYYTYFEGLLDIDVYDGTPSEKIQQIIANLPADSKGADVVRAALIRLGSPYSKSKRGSGNYVDCSYFAWWAYNQVGIRLPKSSVEQARYCYNKKCIVDLSDLQPGDLIFWSKTDCHCGRWREIHHVGIYIGDKKVIEASSSKGRVVIRKLWGIHGGQWRIRMCARPYEING